MTLRAIDHQAQACLLSNAFAAMKASATPQPAMAANVTLQVHVWKRRVAASVPAGQNGRSSSLFRIEKAELPVARAMTTPAAAMTTLRSTSQVLQASNIEPSLRPGRGGALPRPMSILLLRTGA